MPYLQEEVVLAAQKTQVLLGLFMMLFPEALLLATTTGQQIQTPFFWRSLINRSGQMFMFEIMPRLLFLYSGVVCRSVKFLAPSWQFLFCPVDVCFSHDQYFLG